MHVHKGLDASVCIELGSGQLEASSCEIECKHLEAAKTKLKSARLGLNFVSHFVSTFVLHLRRVALKMMSTYLLASIMDDFLMHTCVPKAAETS